MGDCSNKIVSAKFYEAFESDYKKFTNEQLVAMIQAEDPESAVADEMISALVANNTKFICMKINEIIGKNTDGTEDRLTYVSDLTKEDLFQIGVDTLVKKICKFQASKGCKFLTYAGIDIGSRINDAVIVAENNSDRCATTTRSEVKYNKFYNEEWAKGTEPAEIIRLGAKKFGIGENTFARALRYGVSCTPISLDAAIDCDGDSDDDLTIMDVVGDAKYSPEELYIAREDAIAKASSNEKLLNDINAAYREFAA